MLVVDDGSSPADRSLMLSAFPRFTYVFKGPADVKGDLALSPRKLMSLDVGTKASRNRLGS